MRKHKILTIQELKIITKVQKFRSKILKILDNAKLGRVNYLKNDLSNYMASSLADLINYCNIISSGEFKKAAEYDMDTSVREAIPEDIFDFVDNYLISARGQKLSFKDWKNQIANLLVQQKFAYNKRKAKHYMDEADSVVGVDMGLKDHYNRKTTPQEYIYFGEIKGFWEQNPFSKSEIGM